MKTLTSLLCAFAFSLHAQPAAPADTTNAVLDVKKLSVRGYKDLYFIKRDMTQKDAVVLFASRGAKLATAHDARELLSLSDAAFELKASAPIDLRIVNKVLTAADTPFKFPPRKADSDELKKRFGSFNFTDGIDTGYVVVGEKHIGGHFYRAKPDTTTHSFWFVTTTDPLRLRGKP